MWFKKNSPQINTDNRREETNNNTGLKRKAAMISPTAFL